MYLFKKSSGSFGVPSSGLPRQRDDLLHELRYIKYNVRPDDQHRASFLDMPDVLP